MPTRGGNRLACCKNPWAYHKALVDGVAKRNIHPSPSTIAHAREPGHQGPFRINRRLKCNIHVVKDKPFQQPVFTRLTFKMNMHIDEAWHDRLLAEVYDLACRVGLGESFVEGNNFISFYYDGHL